MGLIADAGPGPIALDTSPFIYLAEDHPGYAPLVDELFAAAELGEIRCVTSALTLLEVLVVPLRRGDRALASRYEAMLTDAIGLTLVPIDLAVLRIAAEIRGTTRVRTPDALQLAAALATGCTTFVTNDRRIPTLPGLRVLVLDDYA